MIATYVPIQSDLVQLEFTPQSGSEQAGRRPALVVYQRLTTQKLALLSSGL